MEEKDIVTTGVEGQDLAAPENPAADSGTDTVKTQRNAYFADQRRKQQLDAMRADNARLQRQIDAANKMVETAGSFSTSPDSIVENIQPNHFTEMENQLNIYREREIQRLMDSDLKEIQSIDPTITSLEDLPPMFRALRFNTVEPVSAAQAFVAAQAVMRQTKQPKPASAGSISGSGSGESDFYTSEELDALTPKMLDDKKIMEKALRSMARLKKERG